MNAASQAPARVLVVDDDPGIRDVLTDYLIRQGFEAEGARDAQEMDRLLARLRALDRRHGDTLTSRLAVGDLVLDSQRRVATRGGREISFTSREYAFLTYLARNAGRVVTRAELMENVWDDHQNSYSNIIDVYAGRIRRKIDEGERVALFSTIRGVGFILEVPRAAPQPRQRKRAAPRRE